MAKGRDKHQARLDGIGLLGKDLARRAHRRCELCEGGEDIRPHDLRPDREPNLDSLVLLCARCRALVAGRQGDPSTLRFLESAIWSDVSPVAKLARSTLKTVDAAWAREALDLLPPEPDDTGS